MDRIGIRELRQHASRYLTRVARGETIEVTDRGRPVARLVPITDVDPLEALEAAGHLRRARGDLLDITPSDPIPGAPTLSEALAELRDGER